ncbi:MAG: hypothetical protein AAF517_04180 [Planctomycetota bacterium]
MSLFDFFFPQQAAAQHLRSLATQKNVESTRHRSRQRQITARVDSLEDDLGYVTLLLGSIIDRLDDKGVVTREDLREVISNLDDIDGVKDGRLDITFLRGSLY